MKLPEAFLKSLQKLLGGDYSNFLESFDQDVPKSLRVNRLKVNNIKDLYDDLNSFDVTPVLEPVPWCETGVYYPPSYTPGQILPYALGLYYIQEASAMLPARILQAKPGERILDLCAAPGGKTTQIASDLQGRGLVVSNEIKLDRARVLMRNIEQQGIANAYVTHAAPSELAKVFTAYFDAILVDAPCSGEGMFRRDPKGIKSWEQFGYESYPALQLEILSAAQQMLKPGGRLIYSTCTFNTLENEGVISEFLNQHPSYRLDSIEDILGEETGLDTGIDLPQVVRAWPHQVQADGHFCARLIQEETPETIDRPKKKKTSKKNQSTEFKTIDMLAAFEVFSDRYLTDSAQTFLQRGRITAERQYLHLEPEDINLSGLHVLKRGLFLGEIKAKKKDHVFIPSQAMLMAMRPEYFKQPLCLDPKDLRIWEYTSGQTLFLTEEEQDTIQDNTWLPIFAGRFPLGWTHYSGGSLKNKYPKAWVRGY